MRRSRSRSSGRPLAVFTLAQSAQRGVLKVGNLTFPCAVGRSGCRARKCEGDGATPAGRWHLLKVLYRTDRVRRPRTALPVSPLRENDGWCDAPGDRNYNRHVRHPYAASAERLWRQDMLYDVVVVLDYNGRPRARGRGSAIFMHVAKPDYTPTEGCVALARPHLLRVLQNAGPGVSLVTTKKKRPKLSLRALRARTGEVACSDHACPMERGPRVANRQ
jgi:L,D-peptidoglycan transpeptidase YkuD (ErfK/YbiS/YcfS/YnhG family)